MGRDQSAKNGEARALLIQRSSSVCRDTRSLQESAGSQSADANLKVPQSHKIMGAWGKVMVCIITKFVIVNSRNIWYPSKTLQLKESIVKLDHYDLGARLLTWTCRNHCIERGLIPILLDCLQIHFILDQYLLRTWELNQILVATLVLFASQLDPCGVHPIHSLAFGHNQLLFSVVSRVHHT